MKLLGVVLRPESMSSLEVASLLGFLCGLGCDMDTRMGTEPVRVWVRFLLAEALTTI